MSGLFSKPKPPPPPVAPPPPPEMDPDKTKEAEMAAAREREIARKKQGRAATILTGRKTAEEQPPIGGGTLIGGS